MSNEELQNTLRNFIEKNHTQPFYTCYLSGSVVEGYSTKKSDYDIYIILNEVVPMQEDEIFLTLNGKVCEITYVTKLQLESIFSKIKNNDHLDWYELHLMHRLNTGLPLVNCEEFYILRQEIPVSNLLDIMKKKEMKFAEKCFSDAMGNVLSNDLITAVFNAERTLNAAVDSLLAHSGSTSTLIKWRLKNLVKYYGENHLFVDAYKKIYSLIDLYSNERMMQYICSVGKFWQSTLDYIHAKDHFKKEIEINETNFCTNIVKLCMEDSLVRNPIFRVINDDNRYILIGLNAICEINEQVHWVWVNFNKLSLLDNSVRHAELNMEEDTYKQIIQGLKSYKALI